MFKPQTFWNEFINDQNINTFNDWVKDSEAESKIYLYNHLLETKYNNIIDLGCGTATVYYGILKRKIPIIYTGVDSCNYFVTHLQTNDVNVIHSDIRDISCVAESSYDLAFGRHVLEHQDNFKSLLSEMIRIGKKEVIHIFFIKPTQHQEDIIKHTSNDNLYHNSYSKIQIEKYLNDNSKVKNYSWVNINDDECALHINFS